VPVIAPLLTKRPDVMVFVRAVADFITITQYTSHDAETIRYLRFTLSQLNKTKVAFATQRAPTAEAEAHWNYPKFHVLSHYPSFIEIWGAPDGYDSSMMEAAHKYMLKIFYGRTNKGKDYLDQIAEHNTRAINIQAMDAMLKHHLAVTYLTQLPVPSYTTSITRDPINIREKGFVSSPTDYHWIKSIGFNPDITTTAIAIERSLGLLCFTDILAVFVQYNRLLLQQGRVVDLDLDKQLEDSTWVYTYPIQLHTSLQCWRRTGKNHKDTELLEPERLWCQIQWGGDL
jgi:hypothetical protein